MSSLTLHHIVPLTLLTVSLAVGLVSCGNKGDLYLIPDDFSEQDLEQLERVLGAESIPATEPVDVDDQSVFDKNRKPVR
ncbi:MAG: lipoprotein [Granulosicoccus sp.]|nr:lipoprotein [Granulosicoccus sp.]